MTRTKKSHPASLVRSSAAEYLTFVAASGGEGVESVVRNFRKTASEPKAISPGKKGRKQ